MTPVSPLGSYKDNIPLENSNLKNHHDSLDISGKTLPDSGILCAALVVWLIGRRQHRRC